MPKGEISKGMSATLSPTAKRGYAMAGKPDDKNKYAARR
jgi:hypothetical protein